VSILEPVSEDRGLISAVGRRETPRLEAADRPLVDDGFGVRGKEPGGVWKA